MRPEKARPKTMTATMAAPGDSLQEIIRRMDWAAMEIVLVVGEDGVLTGTITDGDIRRAILGGIQLDQPAELVMNPHPIAVPESATQEEMLDIMRRFSIRHLPVLDAQQRPLRLELLENMLDGPAEEQRAVIMAGGLGQRLRPLTADTPKPMLKIADRPIIDHILAGLRRNGIEDVVISVNYLGEHIRRHIGDGNTHQLSVSYVDERQRLGTAGALSLLQPRPRQAFLVMNGDLLTDINFNSLFRYQRKHRHAMVMCVRRHRLKIPYGVVDIRGDRITDLREKPVYEHFINAGIYIVEPHCLDMIPRGCYFDMPDLIRKVMESGGSVGAFPVVEYWRDIGNPDDFNLANREKMNAESVIAVGDQGIPLEIIARAAPAEPARPAAALPAVNPRGNHPTPDT